MTMGNCYSNALHSPALGELKPGGLALTFGTITQTEFNTLWGYNNPSFRGNRRVFLGACLSGLSMDGAVLLNAPALPQKRPGQYLLALFTKETGRYLDFHFAHSQPDNQGWVHHHYAQYGHGDELFIVKENISDPHQMEAQGLWDYDFQVFAEIPPGLHAKLGF